MGCGCERSPGHSSFPLTPPRLSPWQLDPLPEESMRQKPNANAVRSLEAVIQVQSECPTAGRLS